MVFSCFLYILQGGYNRRKRAFDFLLVTAPDLGSFEPDLVTRHGRPACSSQWQRGQKTNLHLSLLQVACCSSEGVEEEGRGGEGGVTQGAGLVTRQGEVHRGQWTSLSPGDSLAASYSRTDTDKHYY